ncbi:hypothetical protein Q8A73_002593 [Channa argus]|nr:hypothetical protein Q8A73_002593 [Channa argus]
MNQNGGDLEAGRCAEEIGSRSLCARAQNVLAVSPLSHEQPGCWVGFLGGTGGGEPLQNRGHHAVSFGCRETCEQCVTPANVLIASTKTGRVAFLILAEANKKEGFQGAGYDFVYDDSARLMRPLVVSERRAMRRGTVASDSWTCSCRGFNGPRFH